MTRNEFCWLLAALPCAGVARAAGKVPAIHKDRKGVALSGYDAVAYFTEQKPMKGSAAFTHEWMGATWQFSSAANRDRFAADPAKYAPQFGGYCAWAVSNNYTAPADPQVWKIVDGRLYVNYNRQVQEKWQQDLAQRIANGERNWPGLHQ